MVGRTRHEPVGRASLRGVNGNGQPDDEREPDLMLLSGGNLIGVFICSRCGAAIVQLTIDEVDRAAQHAQWHRLTAE